MLIHALATIERGAMGNHAIALNEEVAKTGIETATYAETIREEFRDSVHYYSGLRDVLTSSSTVLYQLGNESPVADLLYDVPCKLVVNYHNITPASYFTRWNPPVAASIGRARAQLSRLASVATAAIAVSEFNADELRRLGYRNVEVIPPLFNNDLISQLQGEKSKNHGQTNELLFVGRIAPHKRQDFLIRVCDVLNNDFNFPTRLTLVGRTDAPVYLSALKDLVSERGLDDKVTFIEDATTAELATYYSQANAFVCASEHEGFCIPLIEALNGSLPVVARDFGAIRETLGGAGMIIVEDDPKIFAAGVREMIENKETSSFFAGRSAEVLHHFDRDRIAARYVDSIKLYMDSL